ncbi:MAG: helix-turn-helix transcriptional regulator [Sphaerochaetaceae bacterium]|nr:helix-turn-helix transcriptional regulator [Sphaerochaetaceae bacterium]
MGFGEQLKKARTKRGLRQEDIGKIVHVGKSTVSQWENNIHVPDLETVNKIADYLNVSTDYLHGRTSDPRTIEEIKKQPFDYSELFTQEDEGQAYILASELRYKQNLSDETFLKIIDEIARFYNRDQKPLEGGNAAHGPDIPGTGGFTKEELESYTEDNKGDAKNRGDKE